MYPIVDWMTGELGIHEATGANDGVPWKRYCNSEAPPRGLKGWEWCAAMVVKGFETLKKPLPGKGRLNWSVATMFEELKKAGAIVTLEDARPGDIVAFPRGTKLHGHVEIVTGTLRFVVDGELKSITIETIGGNVGNAVRRVTHRFERRPDSAHILPSERYTPHCTVARWPLDAKKPVA